MPCPACTNNKEEVVELLDSLERALTAAYSGSAEHGSFFRRGGGEYVPSVFMTLNRLRRCLQNISTEYEVRERR